MKITIEFLEDRAECMLIREGRPDRGASFLLEDPANMTHKESMYVGGLVDMMLSCEQYTRFSEEYDFDAFSIRMFKEKGVWDERLQEVWAQLKEDRKLRDNDK